MNEMPRDFPLRSVVRAGENMWMGKEGGGPN
jgi:hypothetical protein